jgi:hypothetical protein
LEVDRSPVFGEKMLIEQRLELSQKKKEGRWKILSSESWSKARLGLWMTRTNNTIWPPSAASSPFCLSDIVQRVTSGLLGMSIPALFSSFLT